MWLCTSREAGGTLFMPASRTWKGDLLILNFFCKAFHSHLHRWPWCCYWCLCRVKLGLISSSWFHSICHCGHLDWHHSAGPGTVCTCRHSERGSLGSDPDPAWRPATGNSCPSSSLLTKAPAKEKGMLGQIMLKRQIRLKGQGIMSQVPSVT